MTFRTAAFFFTTLLLAPSAFAEDRAPLTPEVDDPMLAPAKGPARTVASWQEAISFLKARSIDLRSSLLEITRAEARTRTALAGALPTLNGTATLTHQFLTNTTPVELPIPNTATGVIQLVQPLFAPRVWYAIGTAEHAEDVSRFTVSDIKRKALLGVANSIVGVVTAERVAELNRVGLRNSLERLELTKKRAALGGAMGLDIVRAAQDVAAARATLIDGDESLRQSREALGLALGLPEQVGVPPNLAIDGLEKEALALCKPNSSLDQRPDIASARQQITVAKRNVDDARYAFSPTITAQSTAATTSVDTFPSPRTTWNIQGILSVPFWDGGARYGNLRDASARYDQANLQLEGLKRSVQIEIVQAERSQHVAANKRAVIEEARNLSAQSDALTRAAYQEGRGTSLELVVAAAQLRQAEINLALADFQLVRARLSALLTRATCNY